MSLSRRHFSKTDPVIWLVLIRMKPPLLLLIFVYSVSIIGMVLVPGPTIAGVTTYMSFFHAVYFVSIVSTTIGLGEVPFEFSDAQRLWSIFVMYITVISWLYFLGKIFALVQDPAYRKMIVEKRFMRCIKMMKEPFFIICGYGEAGENLTKIFTNSSIHVVVIDKSADRINSMEINETTFPIFVPRFCADAKIAENLLFSGIQHPKCQHLIAVTGDDETNLKIAISGKIHNPNLNISCRVDRPITEANMLSFGIVDTINPLRSFSKLLTFALERPNHYILSMWLTNAALERHLNWSRHPPHGLWVICGYGRLGQKFVKNLTALKIPWIVIEPNYQNNSERFICGLGVDIKTLEKANIKQAVGIFAGTDNDVNNLSIIMTARELNPAVFTVARQNIQNNQNLFAALNPDLILHPPEILSREIYISLIMPLLNTFLEIIEQFDDEQILLALRELEQHFDNIEEPKVWIVQINEGQSPTITTLLEVGQAVQLRELLVSRRHKIDDICKPILLMRNDDDHSFIPHESKALKMDDKILFYGSKRSYFKMLKVLKSDRTLLS